jgi:DNA-binding NarL/FixJ family response regulator
MKMGYPDQTGANRMTNRILVVTPDPIVRYLLRDVLSRERAGDIVETASVLEEAPFVELRWPIDMLIIEEAVPGMDSIECIERVQARNPDVQVILVTAADDDEMVERSRNRPVSFTLFTKPFSVDRFLRHVDCVLAQRALSRAAGDRA